MTDDDLGVLLDGLLPALTEHMTQTLLEPLQRRLGAAEAELQRLAERGLEYVGVWKPNTPYRCGVAVTWGGSLWIARRLTTAKPGEPTDESRAWTLAVKRGDQGQDGRDADGQRRKRPEPAPAGGGPVMDDRVNDVTEDRR